MIPQFGYLILDSNDAVEDFLKNSSSLIWKGIDLEIMVFQILDFLRLENTAITELEENLGCIAICSSVELAWNQTNVLSYLIFKLGNIIYNKLKSLNAYQNGILMFRYNKLLGKDIVLYRMEINSAGLYT